MAPAKNFNSRSGQPLGPTPRLNTNGAALAVVETHLGQKALIPPQHTTALGIRPRSYMGYRFHSGSEFGEGSSEMSKSAKSWNLDWEAEAGILCHDLKDHLCFQVRGLWGLSEEGEQRLVESSMQGKVAVSFCRIFLPFPRSALKFTIMN
jgi:hypothetical protein